MSSCSYRTNRRPNQECSCFRSSKCQNERLTCDGEACRISATCAGKEPNVSINLLNAFDKIEQRLCYKRTGIDYDCDSPNCDPPYPKGTFVFAFPQSTAQCRVMQTENKWNLKEMECTCETCDCLYCSSRSIHCTCTVEGLSEINSTTQQTAEEMNTTTAMNVFSTRTPENDITAPTFTNTTSKYSNTTGNTPPSLTSAISKIAIGENTSGDEVAGGSSAGLVSGVVIVCLIVGIVASLLCFRQIKRRRKTNRIRKTSESFFNKIYCSDIDQMQFSNLQQGNDRVLIDDITTLPRHHEYENSRMISTSTDRTLSTDDVIHRKELSLINGHIEDDVFKDNNAKILNRQEAPPYENTKITHGPEKFSAATDKSPNRNESTTSFYMDMKSPTVLKASGTNEPDTYSYAVMRNLSQSGTSGIRDTPEDGVYVNSKIINSVIVPVYVNVNDASPEEKESDPYNVLNEESDIKPDDAVYSHVRETMCEDGYDDLNLSGRSLHKVPDNDYDHCSFRRKN